MTALFALTEFCFFLLRYPLMMLLLVGASLAAIGFVPALAAAAFFLPMCKVFAGVATRPARPNLPRLGFVELGFTVAFALVVVAAYR